MTSAKAELQKLSDGLAACAEDGPTPGSRQFNPEKLDALLSKPFPPRALPSPDKRRPHPLVSCLPIFLAQVAGSYGWSTWVEDPKRAPYLRMLTLTRDGGRKLVFAVREDGELWKWEGAGEHSVTVDEALHSLVVVPKTKKRAKP